MTSDDRKSILVAEEMLRSRSLTDQALARLWRDRLSLMAIGVIMFLTIASIAAPLITGVLGVDPNTTDASESKFLPVFSEGHILGTITSGATIWRVYFMPDKSRFLSALCRRFFRWLSASHWVSLRVTSVA